MGSIALHADLATSPMPEPNAPRSAILASARRVAERDGIPNLSLLSVAQEAGLPPGVVYAFFNSRNDLLLSVVSDDLAVLAHAMRGAFDVNRARDNDDRPAAGSPTGPDDVAQPASVAGPGAGAVTPAAIEESDAQQSADPAFRSDAALEAIAKLQETVARLEMRPVDTWLERRLREFERSLSALEGRHVERSGVEKSVEERFRELNDGLESLEHRLLTVADTSSRSLVQRIDACENRLRGVASDTQADATTLATRVTALENAAFAVKPEFFSANPGFGREAEKPAEDVGADPLPDAASAEPIVAAAAPISSYLASARQSAQAAAVAQDSHARTATKQGTSKTTVYVAIGSLILFVAFLAGAGFLLRNMAMGAPPRASGYSTAGGVTTALALPLPTQNPALRLRTLAEAGNPKAELLIGLQYLDGSGASKNDGAAFAWLSRAASRNEPVAQYELGVMYENGHGVSADPVQAFHWFESAALKGNRRAMHSLATAYAEGRGTEKNISDAARWFGRAAELGSVNDQFNLGVLFERGMGVTQSLPDAYKWYAIAAAQGDRESQSRIAAIAPMLTPDALAAAQDAAKSFKPDVLSTSANSPPVLAQMAGNFRTPVSGTHK